MGARWIAPLLLAAVLLVSSCGLSLQNASFGTEQTGPSKRITAVFTDLGQLPLGGVVRSGQAAVGRVASIETRDFHAVVELDIADDFRVPAGTRARLQLSSPLSEEFVMLERPEPPAAGPPLTDGDVIGIQRTARGPDIEDTLAAAGTVLNGSGLDQARTIVGELNTALRGREDTARGLLHELNTVLGALDRRRGEIDSALASMHEVSEQLADDEPLLDSALTEIRPGIDVLLEEQEQFERLLNNTAELSSTTNDLVQRTDGSVTRQVRQLRPVLEDLRGFNQGIGRTLGGLERFSKLFQRATPGDYVLFNGDLDVPGTLAELLNPQIGSQTRAPSREPVRDLLEGGAR